VVSDAPNLVILPRDLT